MVAASAAIAVAYPHMNSLGGDGFWLVCPPQGEPIAIDACGYSAAAATPQWYAERGLAAIPGRGGAAALCMGGTVDGWRVAREVAGEAGLAVRPLPELLAPAIAMARDGIEVTTTLVAACEKLAAEDSGSDEFRRLFLPGGVVPAAGDTLRNPELGDFIATLAREGSEAFYRGSLTGTLQAGLAAAGSPLAAEDFADYRARRVAPLQLDIDGAQLYNLPAPTQGVASLLILGIYQQLRERLPQAREVDRVHCLVEATKHAFAVRDAQVCDPQHLSPDWAGLLQAEHIAALAGEVDGERAAPWPREAAHGDTVWMGALDDQGWMVSFIQSVYWEFGSAVVIPGTGLVWNNRGLSFSLDPDHVNCLRPRCKPFHTLNPAAARCADGRRMVYGTMGGEGQPQTQAALFSRYYWEDVPLAEAIADGRWLLGRTWGDSDNDLKIEESLFRRIGDELAARGHAVKCVPQHVEMMGHAGAICLSPDASVEAASDPRSDGAALHSVAAGGAA
ncbi:gamma-glutamyltransferase [Mangrovimicrobium sediminis]|uniref:Gamma-glutamyltransferase n=2 Tax=Mangrovimicrobium sediminis TaxID=2562682 RepID=A0A4Z0M5Y3_9GAMM|nr:gamma-glutamyltransferase [Haliea sp. SAOS-164]